MGTCCTFAWQELGRRSLGDRGIILKVVEKISLLGRLRQKLINTKTIEAFDNKDQDINCNIQQIKKEKPKYIAGYASTLLRLAELPDASKLEIPVLFSTGEMLYPNQRRQLEDIFKCKSF